MRPLLGPAQDLVAQQDGLIARHQALALGVPDVDGRLGTRWQVVLPGVYATFRGTLTERQLRRAALLHAGPEAMLNDRDALVAHCVPYLPVDAFVRVLVPATVQRVSREFVIIRRTVRPPQSVLVEGFPVVPVERALAEFAARHSDERTGLAVVTAAVQSHRASLRDLVEEVQRGPSRGRPKLTRIVSSVAAGVRSAPENDFRQLVLSSTRLPEPLWNPRIRLTNGRELSPDALFEDAGLIHETNGRAHHAATDEFEDMQRRHDLLVAAGFTVLHNSPRRIRDEGRAVLREVEASYTRLTGRGLPSGVQITERGPG